MRLLLVEDDPRLAQLIGRGLREDGLVVEHAESASLGSNLAEFRSYDLLVLDVTLTEGPEAGFELVRRLRARGDATPILFLTARADTDSKVAGLETGDDYLVSGQTLRFPRTAGVGAGAGAALEGRIKQSAAPAAGPDSGSGVAGNLARPRAPRADTAPVRAAQLGSARMKGAAPGRVPDLRGLPRLQPAAGAGRVGAGHSLAGRAPPGPGDHPAPDAVRVSAAAGRAALRLLAGRPGAAAR